MKTALSAALVIIILAATAGGARAQQDGVAASPTIEARLKALDAEFEAKKKDYYKAHDKAKTAEERLVAVRTFYPDDLAYGRRFVALAKEDPKGPTAPDALYAAFQAVGHAPYRVPKHPALSVVHEQLALAQEVLEVLRRDHAADPKMGNYLQQIGLSTGPRVEALLRAVLARNTDRTARGHASQALGNLLGWTAEGPAYFAKNPELVGDYEKIHGKAMLDWMKSHDPTAAMAEAESLHERVVAEFADVRLFPAYPTDKQTIGDASVRWLASRRELAVGKPAPEIVGKDVDGHPLKLSDYRGKVVALVFWASWCGPCMAEVPHERELARKMEGKPFALLGVNMDYKAEKARSTLAEEKITWPNWYDGDPREDSPIGTLYHIRSIPAVFVLDGEGIIRARDVRGDALVKAVETLLKEHASATGK
jgi:thiol-disulfide isomerase/thioredoxin